MKREFRNRAFLPVVMPLAILLGIGVMVGIVALILLYVDREGAVAVAIAGAAGILVAISLAASKDRLDAPRKGAVLLAGIVPLAVGGLVAAGAIGGVPDEDRNINAEPHGPQFVFDGLLEGAPVLAAESAASFCLPSDGGCEDTNEWEFSYTPEQIAYAFDNQDSSAQHNLFIYAMPDQDLSGLDAPLGLGDLDANGQLITPGEPPTFMGPVQQTYQWTPPAEGEETEELPAVPEQAYFVCTVHPGSMWGVATITPEA